MNVTQSQNKKTLIYKKNSHLLLDLNLVEPIHNLDVHLLLLYPLVHLGWQGNMPCGTYMAVYLLEHKTCDILAAERLRLMRFDNRLIIDSFQEAVCLLKW